MEHYILIAVAGLVVVGIEYLVERRTRQEREHQKSREREHLKLIHNLSNRLSAKDLSGYMALEQNDSRNRQQPTRMPVAGDDALEAEAERLRDLAISEELEAVEQIRRNGAAMES